MQWKTVIAKDWRNRPATPAVKTFIQEVQTQLNSLQGKAGERAEPWSPTS